MGAKFTIVLDTDDPQGLRDAWWQHRLQGEDRKDRTYQDDPRNRQVGGGGKDGFFPS